jgi:predicted nucleotidyltransferase
MPCDSSVWRAVWGRPGVLHNQDMAKKVPKLAETKLRRRYRGPDFSVLLIRRFARHVAESFQPDTIIPLGSYAFGSPNADSDLDILFVMPVRNLLGIRPRRSR